MRVSRSIQLPQTGGLVHKTWRAHNKEFLLAEHEVKNIYFDAINRGLGHRSVKKEIQISAFCLMNNHCHQLVRYKEQSVSLSNFMRISHSSFGQIFNKIKSRQGPVAYDRAATSLVKPTITDEMKVHFYIEANPLRANITKNLKSYLYSSYRFYAFGIQDKYSDLLTIPKWYIALGRTWHLRQKRYRQLFALYLKQSTTKIISRARFVGPVDWVLAQEQAFRERLRAKMNYG